MAHQPGGDPPRRIPMARRRPTLMDPPVEDLLDKVDSKFTLVALSSKRARQINSYYNQLGESLGVIVPPQVTSVSGKPLTIAFEEIASAKTTYHRTDPDGEEEIVEISELEPGELTLGGVAIVPDVPESEALSPVETAPIEAVSDVPASDETVSVESASSEAAEPPAPEG
jgi:DNA-directed RNA polymerase subunit omega